MASQNRFYHKVIITIITGIIISIVLFQYGHMVYTEPVSFQNRIKVRKNRIGLYHLIFFCYKERTAVIQIIGDTPVFLVGKITGHAVDDEEIRIFRNCPFVLQVQILDVDVLFLNIGFHRSKH